MREGTCSFPWWSFIVCLSAFHMQSGLEPNQTLHPTAACPVSCHRHRKFRRLIRSGRLLPAAVGELFVRHRAIVSKKATTAIALVIFLLVITAVVLSNFIPPRVRSAAPCVNRLMQISGAKEQWALEYGKTTNDVPTWTDLYPYLSSSFTNSWFTNNKPVCPEGGVYILGRVGELPTCSIGGSGHSHPR